MNAERLVRLADLLDTLNDSQFDLRHWVYDWGKGG
jgi:hypothetical protein